MKRIVIVVLLLPLILILIPYANLVIVKADQINVQTLSDIDATGEVTCSAGSKPVTSELLSPLDGSYYTGPKHLLSWEARQYPENLTAINFILTDQKINESSRSFVLSGIEVFDSICHKHIDLLKPPAITFNGTCHPPRRLELYGPGINGSFNSFKSCFINQGAHA